MSTSPHEGRLLSGYALSSNRAIGASGAQDYALNNLLHYADEYAQVRVAFSTASIELTPRYSDNTVNRWYPIAAFGPFPVTLRASGKSYSLRVRVAGANSNNASTVKFRVVLSPQREAQTHANATLENFVFETATTSSSTSAWLTGTSQGTPSSTTLLNIPADYAAAWSTTTATLVDVGGYPVSVQQCLVSACVFGSTASLTSIPELHGLYLAEYVGLT